MWAEKAVGERIEKLRKEHDLSRAQFGKRVGLTEQHIGRIERGQHRISGETISRICCELGVSSDHIIFGVDNTTAADALGGLSWIQVEIALDLLRRLAHLVYTDRGNNTLIQEVLRQQRPCPAFKTT